MPELTPARIQLDATGTPHAPEFSDCYFSQQDGLAESRYVFLQGNHLPQHWQGRKQFTIAETGFGTGLNFLATWQAWREDSKRCEYLHYVSIEKHPIPVGILRVLLASWPELQALAGELLANHPPLLYGFHRLRLAQGHITLTLCFMDVQAALPEIIARVDAWYLDGFAPARNPLMWELPTLQGIARLSHGQTTFATFTAAGEVRRNLQAAGFHVTKLPGFGKKREMLSGVFAATSAMQQTGYTERDTPWFSLPAPSIKQQATVIGGGIAGCQIAYALAQRGWHITLLERHARLATEASGNRAGILTPKMTAEPGWGELFYRQTFIYALQQINQLERSGAQIEWKVCGALQLAHEPREAARQEVLRQRGLPADFIRILDRQAASEIAGIPLPTGASYFPQASWLNPASLCNALTAHPNIEIRCQTHVGTPTPGEITIIANGREADQWTCSAFLPFMPVMGQTSRASTSNLSSQLRTCLGHEGYLTPAINREHIFGATFQRNVREPVLDTTADQINFQQLAHYLPELADSFQEFGSSHAAIRMTTPDRYPMVGPLPEQDFFLQAYTGLKHGNMRQTYPPAQYQEGLFISAGYGSRGLSTSGLCAELLAAQLNGEPLPLQATLYQHLHPARFLLRELKRGKP